MSNDKLLIFVRANDDLYVYLIHDSSKDSMKYGDDGCKRLISGKNIEKMKKNFLRVSHMKQYPFDTEDTIEYKCENGTTARLHLVNTFIYNAQKVFRGSSNRVSVGDVVSFSHFINVSGNHVYSDEIKFICENEKAKKKILNYVNCEDLLDNIGADPLSAANKAIKGIWGDDDKI